MTARRGRTGNGFSNRTVTIAVVASLGLHALLYLGFGLLRQDSHASAEPEPVTVASIFFDLPAERARPGKGSEEPQEFEVKVEPLTPASAEAGPAPIVRKGETSQDTAHAG